jgi:hypothetical protein
MTRIEHRYASRRLDAYVDNELGHYDVDRVTGHILDCVDCSAHVRFLLRVRAALQQSAGAARTYVAADDLL